MRSSLGAHVRPRRPGAPAAGRHRAARDLVYENTRLLLLDVEGVPERALEQPAPGRSALHGTRHAVRVRTLSRSSPQPLEWPVVADDVCRRLERRQLRPRWARVRRRRASPAGHEAKPIALATGPLPGNVPRFGSGWKAWLHATRGRSDRREPGSSLPTNRTCSTSTRLSPTHMEKPVVRVTHRVGDSDRRGYEFLQGKLGSWPVKQAPAGPGDPGFINSIPGTHAAGPDGRRPRHIRRRPLRVLARVSEPRRDRSVDVSDDGRPQPDPDRPGACVADGRAPRFQLVGDLAALGRVI